jgi:abhydrolase domain-containing protein 5
VHCRPSPDLHLTPSPLQGYDAGGLFYFRQLARLARLGCDVHAVDLLGHGLSSRPQFRGNTREQGEAFYTDALQHWAEAQGLESYVLMGHSFGGYVSACWALAHPKNCLRLILVGSAGMETHNRACLGHNGQPWGLEGPALEAFNALWYAIQPQAVVRMAGPLGPSIAADYIQRKFGPRSAGGHLSEPESEALQQYCFHCLAGGGRGAVANPPPHHALFFGPGAKCYAPLASRLDDLECPMSFVYGLYDWMDWRDADRVRHSLSRPATLGLVENAGHHVYLENPEGFHDALAAAMADLLPGGPASAAPQWAASTFPGSGAHQRVAAPGFVPGAGKNQPGAPLEPPQLFFGICRYPSGFEDAAVDEELELMLAEVEAECEPGSTKTGAVPYSDRHKDFSLHSN